MPHELALIAELGAAALLPFAIASGTCFIKFSIVFALVRNALGLQQVPSNLTLNAVALVLALFVMQPVVEQCADAVRAYPVRAADPDSVRDFVDQGLAPWRDYLRRHADPATVQAFARAAAARGDSADTPELLTLLPAYALSEINDAFAIGFQLYLPFVVIDLLVSSVLLALGMMMMSPVTVATPIKLLLFVGMDGWNLLSRGLIQPYLGTTR